MNIPQNFIALNSQMSLSATSRDNHYRQMQNCMPIGDVYRDVMSSNANVCLPHGAVTNPNFSTCCEYNNGVPFFLLLLEIFRSSFYRSQHTDLRLERLHRWLIRKYNYRTQAPPRLLIDDRQYRYVHEWLTLLTPQRNRVLNHRARNGCYLKVTLPAGPLNVDSRLNLTHFIEHYMVGAVRYLSAECFCEGNFATNYAIQHVIRHSMTSEHGQYVKLTCNHEPTFMSDCLNSLLFVPGQVLTTRNIYRISRNDLRMNNDINLIDIMPGINGWIGRHINEHCGNDRLTILIDLNCSLNVRNSDLMHAPIAPANYELVVLNDDDGWNLMRNCQYFTVFIELRTGRNELTINIQGLPLI